MVEVCVILCSNRFNSLTFKVIDSIKINSPDQFIIIDDSKEHLSKGMNTIHTGGNCGLGYGRNLAIKKIQSNFVMYADDDDIWLPNKILSVKKFISKMPNSDFIIHSSLVYDYCAKSVVTEINSKRFERFKNYGTFFWKNWLAYAMPISNSSCWCVKASLVKKNPFDIRIKRGVDGNFWNMLLNNKELKINWLEKNLVYYGVNHGFKRITSETQLSHYHELVGDYYNLKVIKYWKLYPAKLMLFFRLIKKVFKYFLKYKLSTYASWPSKI